MILYDGIYDRLKKKKITKSDLTRAIGISSRTIAKIAKGEKLSANTLGRTAWQGCLICKTAELSFVYRNNLDKRSIIW